MKFKHAHLFNKTIGKITNLYFRSSFIDIKKEYIEIEGSEKASISQFNNCEGDVLRRPKGRGFP